MAQEKQRVDTLALHAGQTPDPTTGARAVPIYQTTSFVFDSADHAANLFSLKEFGNIYTRLMNPTTDVTEKRIAALEGGTGALLTSSGMSAIFLAIHNIAAVGDHIVSSPSLYGGTETCFRYTLPRVGVDVSFVSDVTAEKVKAAIRPNTKAVYLETIGNPKGDVADLAAIAAAAHEEGVPLIVDNTFAFRAKLCPRPTPITPTRIFSPFVLSISPDLPFPCDPRNPGVASPFLRFLPIGPTGSIVQHDLDSVLIHSVYSTSGASCSPGLPLFTRR